MSEKLSIELIPRSAWFKNLRNHVGQKTWDILRRDAYRNAHYHCEICGASQTVLHCHEVWEYDDRQCKQKLLRLTAICPACHEVKHFGRTRALGREQEARKHLMEVNGWNKTQCDNHIERAFKIWAIRSKYKWELILPMSTT